ncbi:hypothetical protein C2S52_014503 [Perilla frutescens var. hirtella]|nr:hypothetical protein C2S52_014503 [Perilla frutescens var. hirtella]
MAALHHGAATALHHRRFRPDNTVRVKPVFFVSSFSTSLPAKRARRRNHLREKILETQKNPIIPKLPPANPIVPIEHQPQEIKEVDINQETQEFEKPEASELAEGEEIQELQELQEVEVSVPAGVGIDGRIGKNQFLKYGLWFVGAFVFQTVCAVLFFGLDDNDNKREIVNGSGELRAKDVVLGENGNGGMDGSVDVEMEKKIEEIRLMAREVRERERLQSKRNGDDGEDGEEGGKHVKSGIEEEVDGTMVRLRKKLEKTRFKTPVVGNSSMETKRSDEVEKGDLLYKKKYKFREFSGDMIEKPKGFVGSDDSRVNGDIGEVNGDAGLGDGENQTELSDDDPKAIDVVDVVEEDNKKGVSGTSESTRNTRSKVTKERGTSKEGKRKGVAKPKVIDGNVLEKHKGVSALEPVKSSKLNVEAVKSVKSVKSSDLDTAVVSDKLSAGNGSVRGKGFGKTKSATKSKSEDGLWWSNLPYVLVIFMQRSTGGEGLYTLKTLSSTEDQISYTVAFEDRADATNFCYLLESFFEELGDFNAEVVPLTVKELKEAVKSYSLRALVVKRGQLQLYAGQPLPDAEMALRAMIQQA